MSTPIYPILAYRIHATRTTLSPSPLIFLPSPFIAAAADGFTEIKQIEALNPAEASRELRYSQEKKVK